MLRSACLSVFVGLCCLLTAARTAQAQQAFVIQGENKLALVQTDGKIAWEIPWGGIHDLHLLPGGTILLQRGSHEVVELDPKTGKVLWSYDSARQNGNDGKPVEVHALQPLADGRVMIAESGPARIIEVDREGKLHREIPLKVEHPHPHTDTRLARKIASGNYLVCHEGDGTVREYSGETGKVVWEYPVPMFGQAAKPGHGPEAFGNKTFAAVRLPGRDGKPGNTLLTTGNGHGLLEVTPEKEIVWELHQTDLPGITLAWVTTVEVLENGHYVFGNCHAGPGQPLLIEIDPATKKVVWEFKGYDRFGNNASNSQLAGVKTLR